MPHTKHQEGNAVSNAVAELARAKLSSNNNYYILLYIPVRTYTRCTHASYVAMLLAMCRCSVCMLASHLAATVKLRAQGVVWAYHTYICMCVFGMGGYQ